MGVDRPDVYGREKALVLKLNDICRGARNAGLGDIIARIYDQWGDQVASVAYLQAIESADRADKQLRHVAGIGLYQYDTLSTQTADANSIVIPDDSPTAGRWLLVSNISSGFYFLPSVASAVVLTPPGAPSEGDRYLIKGSGAGGWAGLDNQVAEYESSAAWSYTIVKEGAIIHVANEDKLYVYDGSNWVDFGILIDIPRTQEIWVDKAGNDTLGEVGNFTRPYLTIAAALAAAATGTPAADKRYLIHVGDGEWAVNVTCADFVDFDFGSARIIPAAGDALILAENMSTWGGIFSAAAGYCFNVAAITAQPCNVYGAQYAAGKLITTGGGGGAVANFHGLMPLPGSAVATFCDVNDNTFIGNFFNCILDGAMTSDSWATLDNCDVTGAWTVGDGIAAIGSSFTGAFSLATASAASELNGCVFVAGFTLLEGSLNMSGGRIGGALLLNHANAVLHAEGVKIDGTYTVTLGTATLSGGRVIGALSFAGTNVNRLSGVNMGAGITVLEATVVVNGSNVGGASLTNHANAVLIIDGSRFESTLTQTLGAIEMLGGQCVGALSVTGTGIARFNAVAFGAAATILDATAYFDGCSFVGAVLANHANAIGFFNGCKLDDTFTVTLGQADVNGSQITGNVSYAGAEINYLNGSALEGQLTLLAATLNADGCSIVGAVLLNDAGAIASFNACRMSSTFTVTLGQVNATGSDIVGAVSIAGATTQRLVGSHLGNSLTILEATILMGGCTVVGAVLLNHANAIAFMAGNRMDDAFTVTLGVAEVDGGSIAGAVILNGTNANYFAGVKMGDALTVSEATGHLTGCSIDGAVLMDNAASIGEFEGCLLGGNYTVTLGTGTFSGGRIGGAVSVTGTGTNFISGSELASTLTCLEATLIVSGCAIVGAIVANHASAVLVIEGSDGASTLDITLGAGTLIGCRIVGAVGIVGTLGMSASCSTGAITGTPTYFEDARYGEALRDIGGAGINMIRFTGVPNVDDAFTVNARSYEWDTTGAGVNLTRTPGNVAASLATAVTEINADAAGVGEVHAYVATGAGAANGVLFLIHEAAGTNFALVITVNVGGTMTAGAANSVSDHAAAFRNSFRFAYALTAQDILALAAGEGIIIAGIPSTIVPAVVSLFGLNTAGNAILPLNTYAVNVVQIGANFYGVELVDAAAAAVLLQGDVINVTANI